MYRIEEESNLARELFPHFSSGNTKPKIILYSFVNEVRIRIGSSLNRMKMIKTKQNTTKKINEQTKTSECK